MRANPEVEVTYRNKTVRAVAREAGDGEKQAIWDRARAIYAGYDAYAGRIKNREIHIMVLTAEGPIQLPWHEPIIRWRRLSFAGR
jgi:hypothetical protein